MTYVFEIIGVIFVFIMAYLTYIEFKKSRLNVREFVFWTLLWAGGILLILFHKYVESILPTLSIVRVLDLYMILAFMFLFFVIFHLFSVIKNTEKRVEELVRKVALGKITTRK